MGVFAAKKMYAKSLLEDAVTALNLGKRWTQGSPCKGELGLLRESDSLHLPGPTVRGAIRAGRADDRWELIRVMSLRAKLQEYSHEVKQDDDQRKSIVQQIR